MRRSVKLVTSSVVKPKRKQQEKPDQKHADRALLIQALTSELSINTAQPTHVKSQTPVAANNTVDYNPVHVTSTSASESIAFPSVDGAKPVIMSGVESMDVYDNNVGWSNQPALCTSMPLTLKQQQQQPMVVAIEPIFTVNNVPLQPQQMPSVAEQTISHTPSDLMDLKAVQMPPDDDAILVKTDSEMFYDVIF